VHSAVLRGLDPRTVQQVGGIPLTRRRAAVIGKIIRVLDNDTLDACTNGYEFMECCDLGHIKMLIEDHWSVFSSKFWSPPPPLTSTNFTERFERLLNARNDLYHHKSLPRMAGVVSAAEELLDRLDFSLGFVFDKITSCNPTPPSFSVPVERRHRTWE